MSQASVNIGTIGHVDHGKTSLVQAITNKWADTHSEEMKRGITIKLGYADATIRKCPECKPPFSFTTSEKCLFCESETEVSRKVSFVDSPGHETLMATVIAASSIMDGALFVISANEKCPQPQTTEHLAVLEAAGIRNVVIAQNKVDLVPKERAIESRKEIMAFIKGTAIENAEIIPTAAHSPTSIPPLLDALERNIPTPKRDESASPKMLIARSFDVNKPGSKIQKILGAVVGGSIVRGKLKPGDEIEISPGIMRKKKDRETYLKLETKVVSLYAESEKLEEGATAGGLIGVATSLDPALARADSLVGSIVGLKGTLPAALSEIRIEITPLGRVLENFASVPALNEPLVLGIGTNTTVGFITERKKKAYTLKLKKAVCAEKGEKLAVMRRSNSRWRLYGTAVLL